MLKETKLGRSSAWIWNSPASFKQFLTPSDPRPDKLFWHSFWHIIWKHIRDTHILTFFLAYIPDILLYLAFFKHSIWHPFWHILTLSEKIGHSFWNVIGTVYAQTDLELTTGFGLRVPRLSRQSVCHSIISGIFSGIYSACLSDILSGIYSDIISRVLSGLYSTFCLDFFLAGKDSDILSGMCSGPCVPTPIWSSSLPCLGSLGMWPDWREARHELLERDYSTWAGTCCEVRAR